MCSTSFTQHFSVLKTPGGKNKQTKKNYQETWILKHTIQSSPALIHYKSTCPHLYPPKSPPISNACHDPSKESLQHKNGEKHQQSFFNRLLTDDVPNLTFFIASSQERRLSILLPLQKCSWLPGRKQKAYSSLNKTKPFLIHWVFQNGICSFNKYLLSIFHLLGTMLYAVNLLPLMLNTPE